MSGKQRIFISYSHKDDHWLEKLRTFLRPLERDAELRVWSDQDISPSSDWHTEIQREINDADAAILLVSQDFLASDYVANDELPNLLTLANERGLRIVPVFVSASFLRNSPLLKFQGVNSPQSPLDSLETSEQNKLLAKLAESVDDLLKIASEGVTEERLEKFRGRFESVEGGVLTLGDSEMYNKLHALQEHDISLESFRLGRYVITQGEWKALMNTQPWAGENNVKYGDDIPAVYVNWYNAIDFVRVINKADSQFTYRLPSEAEWEFAARGGRAMSQQPRSRFCFGNDANLLISYGWHDQNAALRGENYAHAVGSLRPNQLNLFDMHGNVWEWTADNLDGLRALRGGGFNFTAEGACSAFRVMHKPEIKSEAVGFRLVQERK